MIPEWVCDIGAAKAVQRRVVGATEPGTVKPVPYRIKITYDKCRMRFCRGMEIDLDPKMHPHVTRLEPTTTALGKVMGLGNFFHLKGVDIKAARGVLSALWHGQLNMFYPKQGHKELSVVAFVAQD